MKSSANSIVLSTLLYLLVSAVAAQQLNNESEVVTTAKTDDDNSTINLEDEQDSTRYIMEILGTIGGTLIAVSNSIYTVSVKIFIWPCDVWQLFWLSD